MNISGFTHVNINCRDFDRSRSFYEALGFRVVLEVPPIGTPEVGEGVGLGPYRVRGALLALESDPNAPLIDLLEWQDPRDVDPPYERLNHLGIARIAFTTTDLDADVAALRKRGVPLLSDPVRVEGLTDRGVRFVCFLDPDGTVLELVQTD